MVGRYRRFRKLTCITDLTVDSLIEDYSGEQGMSINAAIPTFLST